MLLEATWIKNDYWGGVIPAGTCCFGQLPTTVITNVVVYLINYFHTEVEVNQIANYSFGEMLAPFWTDVVTIYNCHTWRQHHFYLFFLITSLNLWFECVYFIHDKAQLTVAGLLTTCIESTVSNDLSYQAG